MKDRLEHTQRTQRQLVFVRGVAQVSGCKAHEFLLVAANAIAYLIPCHRVLRATGALGGYRWGESRKRALLALERRPAVNIGSKIAC